MTVVVPVLNGAAHLRASLDSILAQTHPAVEVIVLDDASSDETPQILQEYASRGVRVVGQPSTRGIYANANDGIALARGEFVGVFHGDDEYEAVMLERQVEYLQRHPGVAAVFAADVFIGTDGQELGRLELPPALRGSAALSYAQVVNALLTHKNCFLRCPSALVRASVYRELGGYDQERFKNTADLEMWLRIARRHSLAVLDEHLFRYRRGHGSSSERYHRVRTDEERFFTILARELELGARAQATPAALAAFEAHRNEDILMRAASHYILGSRDRGREVLREARALRILASPQVQRARLVTLLLALRVLLRMPRVAPVADLFARRWHGTRAAALVEGGR